MANKQQMNLMRQMQKMQDDMAAAQAALAEETVEASVGGGMVTAVVTGTVEPILLPAEALDGAPAPFVEPPAPRLSMAWRIVSRLFAVVEGRARSS